MKMRVLTLFCVLLIGTGIGATRHITVGVPQNRPIDTLQYLQSTIIDHKSNFVNKPLNVLLNALSLPVRSYDVQSHDYKYTVPRLNLYVNDKPTVGYKLAHHLKVGELVIEFQTPVASDSCIAVAGKSNNQWLGGEKAFYGWRTISKIELITNEK